MFCTHHIVIYIFGVYRTNRLVDKQQDKNYIDLKIWWDNATDDATTHHTLIVTAPYIRNLVECTESHGNSFSTLNFFLFELKLSNIHNISYYRQVFESQTIVYI